MMRTSLRACADPRDGLSDWGSHSVRRPARRRSFDQTARCAAQAGGGASHTVPWGVGRVPCTM